MAAFRVIYVVVGLAAGAVVFSWSVSVAVEWRSDELRINVDAGGSKQQQQQRQ